MGLTGSRDEHAVGSGGAYHAYGRAAASPAAASAAAAGSRPRPRDGGGGAPTAAAGDRAAARSGADDSGSDSGDERLVPSLFTWNFGGQSVSVTGAWDGWRQKTPMERNGTEYSVVIFIPCGEYQFKYFVDDNWQCNPALAQQTDEHGNTNNYVKVVAVRPDFDEASGGGCGGGRGQRSDPPSPLSSYDNGRRTDFPGEVPVLPAQIRPFYTRAADGHVADPARAASCVRFEHLFAARADAATRTLAVMHHHNEKTITTILVTSADDGSAPAAVADRA